MLKKIKTIIILVLMAAVAYLLFQGSTFLDSKLENKPTPWIQTETDTVAPVAPSTPKATPKETPDVAYMRGAVIQLDSNYPPLTVDDSPEASNHDHSWLSRMVSNESYPGIKTHVREAFENDGVLRKTENSEIISRSVDWNERAQAGEKQTLRDLVK